ncbi:hypothetical protein C8Q79DRAFT_151848 [Trametes meyenii]|nr:hypothetical protein C8Q79DRAFT_151848 [Trametes meyenii]
MPAPHSHPKHPGSESRQAQIQKSPPPKFINLDDCKPILSTTTTNTSTNSSRNGATAFVFTSSRTLRALQAQEDRVDRQSPILSARSSPATPPTPSSASSLGYHRAQLTLSQLTRHSEGALDARALIGPKMRAAGFVNLPHTRDSRSDLSSGSSNVPGTPSLHSTHPVSVHFHPTPSDPPNFPPLVFVNPSAVTTVPMWEYQRDPQWFTLSTNRAASGSGQPNAGTNSNEPTPGPGDSGASPFFPAMATHPPRRIGMPQSMGSYGSDSSALPSSSGSAYTLFSSNPSPSTGISSGDESEGEGALEKDRKGKIKAVDSKPSEYPFPPTYDHSTIWYSRSHGSRASSATASPTTTYAHPPAAQPSPLAVPTWADSARCETTEKPDSPVRPRRASFEKSAKIEPSTEPRASFAAAPRPQSHQRQYSLTELCVSSPMVWLTKSDVFAAPAPISRSPIRTPSLAPTSLSASMSRPRSVLAPPPPTPPPPHRRHRTAPEKISTLRPERHHRIVSAPLRLPAILSECNSSDQDSEKSSSKAGSKKARDRAKRAAKTDSSRMTSAALSSQRSEDGVPAQDPDGNADRGTAARGRGRNPKGKVLAASETVEERAAAEADAEMERTAKVSRVALVLAHRERDREYARHVAATRERDKLLKQKQRVHHKLRGKLVPDVDPDESETTMVEQPSLSAK